jgi:hypothetical protein
MMMKYTRDSSYIADSLNLPKNEEEREKDSVNQEEKEKEGK